MDPVSQIIQAFNMTINPSKTEEIKQAEVFLEQVKLLFIIYLISLKKKKVEPNFAITLMLIIDNKGVLKYYSKKNIYFF